MNRNCSSRGIHTIGVFECIRLQEGIPCGESKRLRYHPHGEEGHQRETKPFRYDTTKLTCLKKAKKGKRKFTSKESASTEHCNTTRRPLYLSISLYRSIDGKKHHQPLSVHQTYVCFSLRRHERGDPPSCQQKGITPLSLSLSCLFSLYAE